MNLVHGEIKLREIWGIFYDLVRYWQLSFILLCVGISFLHERSWRVSCLGFVYWCDFYGYYGRCTWHGCMVCSVYFEVGRS